MPAWMRSSGLSANDWQVITEYMEVLLPLKEATKRLEGCGKGDAFGAIYEVIPVFEQLLAAFERKLRQFDNVDHHRRTTYLPTYAQRGSNSITTTACSTPRPSTTPLAASILFISAIAGELGARDLTGLP